MALNKDFVREVMARCSDRYTSSELVDLLDIPVEELVDLFVDRILESTVILEELGYLI